MNNITPKKIYILILTLSPIFLIAQDRITGLPFASRSEVIAQNGMAATSQPLCTQIAIDILKKGGSAIDAAIAANACLGLMEPTGSGIGGDLFAIVWDGPTGQIYGLNASGRSPKSLSLPLLLEKGLDKIPSHGPLPVSVPGCVDGWFQLHKKFGKLPFSDILSPAIDYAEKGFPVSELIAYYLNYSIPFYIKKGFPNIESTYTDQGQIPKKGEIFKNPFLANTYKKIAGDGRDAFYKGEMAKSISGFIKDQGGYLSYEDLSSHTSEWVDPVSINYRGYDVWELPPNGQGIAALQMLNILEGFPLSEYGYGSKEHIHYMTEAKKLVFEDRAKFYADMNFADVPVNTLISKKYAEKRHSEINPDRAGLYNVGEITKGETVYLTVADQWGTMISLIQSNYRGMGSGMVPPGLGFMLQDRGELFSLDPDHANALEPGKRPFHTIIPAFVSKDGKPIMSFGVMGGGFQPQGHTQIIVNLIDFGMNLQEAGDAPRMEHRGSSEPTGEKKNGRGEIGLEHGFAPEVIDQLTRMGHKVTYGGSFGGYQAIMYDAENNTYIGASESRKDGCAIGY